MQEIEKYSLKARILHWVHAGAFVTLFLTGLILFLPPLAILGQDSWTRLIHRIAAVIFVVVPIIHLATNWRGSWRKVSEAFAWGPEDLGWLKAAPAYYFLGDESSMPPQGEMNTGQKLWWLMSLVFSVVFIITGFILWGGQAAAGVLRWSLFAHDVAFIALGPMLFVHIYLAVFHPLMTESWKAMRTGKVSAEYAKTHHAKWYEEVASHGEKAAK